MSSSGRARALTFATCVTVGAAHAAAAQSSVPSEPWPATSAPLDSATTCPQLVLGDVIARALAVSPAVAYSAGGVRTVRSLERVAQGAYLPTVLATSAISRTDATGTQSTSGAGGSGVSSNQTFGLSAAVDLFTGGRRGANTALARADLTAANASLISARYSVRLTAQQGFYDEVRAAAFTDVARAALAQAEQLLRYTTDMAPAGVVTRSDVLRAQLQLATTQQQLLAATDTLRAASYALGALVGAAGPVDVKADSASEAIAPLVLDDSTIMRLAAETSPGVIVAQSLQGADDAALRAARSLYTPTISAGASYNASTNSAATSGGARPGWTISAGTSYPLFNGFQREDVVTRARINADVARVTAADASRSARANAAQLLGALHTTSATIALGTEAVRSAREDLRVQNARYRAGISTMLDVLTSESALVQAEFSLAAARHRYHTTRAALEALLGRIL